MIEDKYELIYSADALEDLRGIYEHIAYSLSAEQTANRLVGRIRKLIESLEILPNRYKYVDWEPWHSKNVHQAPIENYLVYYLVDEEKKTVEVLRIFYAGRNICEIVAEKF